MAAGQHEAEAGHSERTGITAATPWRDSISNSTVGVRRRCPRAALNGHFSGAAGQHEAEAGHSKRTGIKAALTDSISSSTAEVRRRCPRASFSGSCEG